MKTHTNEGTGPIVAITFLGEEEYCGVCGNYAVVASIPVYEDAGEYYSLEICKDCLLDIAEKMP